MMKRLVAVSALTFSLTLSAAAQVPATGSTPGVTPSATSAPSVGTLPPGVVDPAATNSTTGTIDREDHCQPPGTPSNTNPSADMLTLPRAEPACK